MRRELSERDVFQLNNAGIGVRLPMTNHYVDREEYLENKRLLKKYHQPGNSIICTNDELAQWIRDDFPDYRLDASVIKNLKSREKIEEAWELYDSVVLPMSVNEDLEFLEQLEDKDKITLVRERGLCADVPVEDLLCGDVETEQGRGSRAGLFAGTQSPVRCTAWSIFRSSPTSSWVFTASNCCEPGRAR